MGSDSKCNTKLETWPADEASQYVQLLVDVRRRRRRCVISFPPNVNSVVFVCVGESRRFATDLLFVRDRIDFERGHALQMATYLFGFASIVHHKARMPHTHNQHESTQCAKNDLYSNLCYFIFALLFLFHKSFVVYVLRRTSQFQSPTTPQFTAPCYAAFLSQCRPCLR